MKKLLKFSIDDISLFREDDNVDFAVAKIRFLASGNNSHKNPISEEVLRRDAQTALGKLVVAKYDKYSNDVETHNNEEVIVGYVPPNSKITFEKDKEHNKLFAVCEAVISKIYATPIYKLFEENNFRSVSSEFSAVTEREEDESPNEIDNPILDFMVHGITILGMKYSPSVKGADIKMMKFSEDEANEYYNKCNNDIHKFAQDRRDKMMENKSYKVNKTELKETPWGNVDKTSLRNKILEAKNVGTLVHDVYAVVESDWKDRPSEALKYPLMELVGDTLYYNRHALSSALGYAKKENETSVVSKVEKLYKKFKLDKEEDKKMQEDKTKKFDDDEEEDKKDDDNGDDDNGDDDGEEEGKEGTKKFSLDANVDMAAIHKMLENETEDYKKLANELLMENNANNIVSKYIAMAKEKDNIVMERDELKKFKEAKEEEAKKFEDEKKEKDKELEVEKIMSEVKDDIETEKFEELKSEGMACKFEELTYFQNKVKAFAYESSKNKPKQKETQNEDKTFKFGLDVDEINNKKNDINSIYDEYLK